MSSTRTLTIRAVLLVLGPLILSTQYAAAGTAVWRPWLDWSKCTQTCGGGVQRSTRTCNVVDSGSCEGDTERYRTCEFQQCPVNGTWAEWTPWTICSVSCGGGIHKRHRECIGRVTSGMMCMGDNREEEACSIVLCAVDGQWGSWGPYGACSATCGGGFRSRERSCDSPLPANGGRTCTGETVEHVKCSQQVCTDNNVVDGSWGPWTLTTDCSSSCGQGTQTRMRSCSDPFPANGGATCPDTALETLLCNHGDCPIDGNWAEWSNFSACSPTCGDGYKERFRLCNEPAPQHNGALCITVPLADNVTDVAGQVGMKQTLSEKCNLQPCQPVNGSWSAWSDVYSCSMTCGKGVQLRMRRCDNPLFQNGGLDCVPTEPVNTTIDGVVAEYKTFNCDSGVPCPVHGVWGQWSPWANCDVTCGTGNQSRTRVCSMPEHRGLVCSGHGNEVMGCDRPVCNVDGAWSSWSSWVDCSASCGGGEKTRVRSCTAPPPSGNGANCTGEKLELESCSSNYTCPPVDGSWSSWAEWGLCSKQCGGAGIRARLRTCDNPEPERGGADCAGHNMDLGDCDSEPCAGERMNGSWSRWGPWNVCSAPCGGGTRYRTRMCDSPPASPGGAPCLQEKNAGPLWFPAQYLTIEDQLEICNQQQCAIDGAWGLWTPWTACTESCGGGMRRRSKACDSPRPQHGGRICPFASPFSPSIMQAQECNKEVCGDDDSATTAAPISTTMPAKKYCTGVPAHDKLVWPQTEVGRYTDIACPTPSVGIAYRKCDAEERWSKVDTTGCKTMDLEELDRKVTYASKALDNVTAITDAVSLAKSICTVELIAVSGSLVTCTRVLIKLAERGIPGDPLLDANTVKHLCGNVFDTANAIMDIKLKELWSSIIVRELNDEVSTLADIPGALFTMATDMGHFLSSTRGKGFRLARDNIEANVEPITCDTFNYRYPHKAPTPTPPTKHIRGGWTPPPEPHTTRFEPSDAYWKEPACYSRRKKRQVINTKPMVGSANNSLPGEKMRPKYPVTIVYHTLHLLLPDINKRPYTAPRKKQGNKYIPIEHMHIVNAKVVSARIVGRTGLMNQSVGVNIRFYHEKEGRDHICASLDTHKRNLEYDPSACNLSETTVNYTVCDCGAAYSTFVLLMKPGVIRDNVTYVVIPDVFLEYGCYIGVVVHVCAILALLFIGLWDADRHWIIINFCLSTILYQLFVVVGRQWVNEDGLCYFMSWLVHYCMTVNISWVLGLTALCFKQAVKPQKLRVLHRFYYVLICWGIPFFVATITASLRHGYVIREYFCWLSTDEYTHLALIIPVVVISIVAAIILAVTYKINSPPDKIAEMEDENSELATKRRFLRSLFAFILIVFFTLFTLGYNVCIGFLIGNIAQCLFVALIFVILNEDVQEGYGNKKMGLEEFIRLKKEMQDQSPELETVRHDGDPDWVLQTRTAPVLEVKFQNRGPRRLAPINETDSLELAKAARRERRRLKKVRQERPVYVARRGPSNYVPPDPVNPRAAAYAAAPTPKLDDERPISRNIPTRTRRSKSRQIQIA